MFKKPNFFILGAPKCGTTSLAAWLEEHPNVYMSNPKELEYFDNDRNKGYSDNLTRYESYFKNVANQHFAIGEASTGYLRSAVAVSEILKYSPQARFIVGLRNPLDMTVSWHGQALFEAWEDEHDFERAWRLQSERRIGNCIPRLCSDSKNLLYGEVCKLGYQMKRLYSQVSRDRVFVYTLDDMKKDPRQLWLRLQKFLGVPDDGRKIFPAYNVAKSVPGPISIVTRIVSDMKRNLGLSQHGLGLLKRLNRQMARERKVSIPSHLREEMRDYYKEDILLLSKTTGINFSSWLSDFPRHIGTSEDSSTERSHSEKPIDYADD